jgi:hypothetical protein
MTEPPGYGPNWIALRDAVPVRTVDNFRGGSTISGMLVR